jgi:hypothetical protein
MAALRLCSIPDCGKPHVAGGWCSAHYMRWKRHGDPLAGNTTPGQPLRYLRETVFTYDGNECLLWPFGCTTGGYGVIWIDGAVRYVHRVVCADAHGEAPDGKFEAAHSCGNGHKGCCTKRHLSWKTPLANTADRFIHGTQTMGEAHHTAKLTEKQVREILSLKGKIMQKDIAVLFGVSKSRISSIHRRVGWKNL